MTEQTAEPSGSNVGVASATWPARHAFAYFLRHIATAIEGGAESGIFEAEVPEFSTQEGTVEQLREIGLDDSEIAVAVMAILSSAGTAFGPPKGATLTFEGGAGDGLEDTAPFARNVDEPIGVALSADAGGEVWP